MKQHLWTLNEAVPTSYDSNCGLEMVSWVNIKGFKAKKCADCRSRRRNYNPRYQQSNWLRNRRNAEPQYLDFWTDEIPAPHDKWTRLWARLELGRMKVEDAQRLREDEDEESLVVYSRA